LKSSQRWGDFFCPSPEIYFIYSFPVGAKTFKLGVTRNIFLILPNLFIFYLFLKGIRNIFLMTTEEIGKTIKFRREFLNLRQEDLAEISGVTSRTIHLIETGTGNPSVETLNKLATVLGLELIIQVKKAN
jgi:DNA-binding XRE family transcriptional regulator